MTPPGACRRASHDADEEAPTRPPGSRQSTGGVTPSVRCSMDGASVRRVVAARAGDTSRCAGRSYGGVRPSSVWLSAILSRTPAISGASMLLKTTE